MSKTFLKNWPITNMNTGSNKLVNIIKGKNTTIDHTG